MAICTQTGLIINDDDLAEYDIKEAEKLLGKIPKGKAKKSDGTLIDLPKKNQP